MNSKALIFTSVFALLATSPLIAAPLEDPAILGYTEPYRIITVSAAESGVLKELLVQEGDAVKQDQVLGRLDTAVLAAELDIARAEAKLQNQRKAKLEELAGSSRASADELERARTDAAVKEAQVRKTEAQIEARTLRTPVAGIVTEIKRDPSEAVSTAQPHVLTVVEIDKLTVNLFLPPAIAGKLQSGTATKLRLLDEANAIVDARIEFLSPVIDAASGTIRVKLAIDNAAGTHRAGGKCSLAE